MLWLLEDAEQTVFEEWRGGERQRHDALPSVPEHAAVLALSDLGMRHPRRWARYNWRDWGRAFNARRCQPLALVPTHPGDWDEETTQHFRCASLDYRCHPQCESAAPARRNAEAEQDDLLTLLAPMARITPALLRQARIEHPAGLSISTELTFWADPRWGSARHFREWRDADRQRHYLERLERDPHLSRLARKLIRAHEKSLPLRLQIQQKQIGLLPLDEEQTAYVNHLRATMQDLEPLERRFLNNWMALLGDRKGEAAWLEELEPLYRQYYDQLPPDQQHDKAPPEQDEAESWWLSLRESSEGLSLAPAPEREQPLPESNARDSREIAVIPVNGIAVVRGYEGNRKALQKTLHPGESLSITGTPTRLTVDVGRKVETFQWPTCPPWASGIGRDRYGLFVEVEIEGVAFVMRWIPPGEFLMGSPEDEPERSGDEESQYRVRFEQGFWLAETACTQALWRAVMGKNPSRFKGEENPVENVSWNDVKQFFDRINAWYPGLELRLPWESEWEYGCRAGTTTPFWFGMDLATDKANYNGNYPYANGAQGAYRKRTLPARYFRPNPWGLYQVHGNVWEWCNNDLFNQTLPLYEPLKRVERLIMKHLKIREKSEYNWYGPYEGGILVDGQPWLPHENWDKPVIRGGSWINFGRRLRSADRAYSGRDFRGGHLGFRFARDPVGLSQY